jgi:hypothetical protein
MVLWLRQWTEASPKATLSQNVRRAQRFRPRAVSDSAIEHLPKPGRTHFLPFSIGARLPKNGNLN